MKAIDLFCGCGGISAGLELVGFNILAGVDVEPKYINTFAHNFPGARSLSTDLTKVSPEEFMESVSILPGELDLLAGGPPCQGFSKNVPRKHRYLEDPNNLLIKTFLDYCEAIRPRMVLMENVAEMKNGFDKSYSEQIRARLMEEGYTVREAVLNAADYGVPQRRKRAFFMASREGILFDVPEPTHFPKTPLLDLMDKSHITVWDAIGDLPSVSHDSELEFFDYPSKPFSPYQCIMRNTQTVIYNHTPRKLKQKQYDRLASLSPGQGLKELPDHLKVRSGYSGAYGRLTKDMIAPTITRWVFHPGSGRWGHPVDIRVITIREAARIQSFPDSFEFVGTYNQQAGQVGNAVPPLLMKKIAESMLSQAGSSSFSKELVTLSKPFSVSSR